MNETKNYERPSAEKIRNQKIFITHILPDGVLKQGLKRLQYFTELESRPDEIYSMMSFERPFTKNKLEQWITSFRILTLPQKVVLPFEKSAWMDNYADIFLLNVYDTKLAETEYKNAKPFANMGDLFNYTRNNLDFILENL